MRNRQGLTVAACITLLLVSASLAGCGGAEARKARHLAKGETYLAARNFEKARVEFQNALQIDPKDPQARLKMGIVDERLQKPREAAQFYQAVIDVDPANALARTNLARLYVFSGAPDRALELIKPALDKHPDDADLLTVRAAARAQRKELGAAREDAERAVQLAPANEGAVAVLAGLYSAAGDREKARTLLEEAVARIPDTVDLRLLLAQLYASQGRSEGAEAVLLKIVELQPKEKIYRLRLAEFYARAAQLDAAERTLRQAIKDIPGERDLKVALVQFLATRRSREQAERELQAMIAAEPGDAELRFALARFYGDAQEWEKAERVYRDVMAREEFRPAGLSARDRLAAVRVQRGDIAGAMALLNEVLAKSPRDDDALTVRGNIELATQDPRAAITDLRGVLRDQPNAVGVLRALARAHLANAEPAIAEETMRAAVEANPRDVNVRLDFAQLLAQLGKPGQAEPMLAQLLKEHPDNVSAADALFRVAMASKDLETARLAVDAIDAAHPKSSIGYLYRGLIAEAERQNEEALRLYSSAAAAQPDAHEPLEAQVRLLVGTKRVGDALERLKEATARNPKDAYALNLEGGVLLSQARLADAADAFRAAITRSPKWWLPYRGLAETQLDQKDVDGALKTLRSGAAVADDGMRLNVEVAVALERTGKPDAAISQYEDVLKRAPRYEIAANNLAMLLSTYKTDGQSLDRAKELASRFSDSINPSYLDTYGWVLYKRGEAAASVTVLKKVVTLVPNEPLARYHLGMAESLAGESAEARDDLDRAVKSGAKFSGREEAITTLNKLANPPTAATAPRS